MDVEVVEHEEDSASAGRGEGGADGRAPARPSGGDGRAHARLNMILLPVFTVSPQRAGRPSRL